jgi:hypothetical protein
MSPTPSHLTVDQLLPALPPLSEIRDLADLLLARGQSPAAVVDDVVRFLDDLIDWASIVKGPAGVALEMGDGPLLRGIVRIIVGHVSRVRSRPTH